MSIAGKRFIGIAIHETTYGDPVAAEEYLCAVGLGKNRLGQVFSHLPFVHVKSSHRLYVRYFVAPKNVMHEAGNKLIIRIHILVVEQSLYQGRTAVPHTRYRGSDFLQIITDTLHL